MSHHPAHISHGYPHQGPSQHHQGPPQHHQGPPQHHQGPPQHHPTYQVPLPPPNPAPINMTRKGIMEHERKMLLERGRHHPHPQHHPYNSQKHMPPPMHHLSMAPPGLNPQYAHYLESLKYHHQSAHLQVE